MKKTLYFLGYTLALLLLTNCVKEANPTRLKVVNILTKETTDMSVLENSNLTKNYIKIFNTKKEYEEFIKLKILSLDNSSKLIFKNLEKIDVDFKKYKVLYYLGYSGFNGKDNIKIINNSELEIEILRKKEWLFSSPKVVSTVIRLQIRVYKISRDIEKVRFVE